MTATNFFFAFISITLMFANVACSISLPEWNSTIDRRQSQYPSDSIALIYWYSQDDCVNAAAGFESYDVHALGDGAGYDPDNCDPGLPEYNNGADIETLPFTPRSFQVMSTPNTCNPDSGSQLESVILWAQCTKQADMGDMTVLYCPDTCYTLGWSLSGDGYGQCINTADWVDKGGPFAFSVEQRTAFCNSEG